MLASAALAAGEECSGGSCEQRWSNPSLLQSSSSRSAKTTLVDAMGNGNACVDADAHVAAAAQRLGVTATTCAQVAPYCASPQVGHLVAGVCCATCARVNAILDGSKAAVPAAVQKVVEDKKCLGITAATVAYRFGAYQSWPFYPLYTSILEHAGWAYQMGYNSTSDAGDVDHMGLWKNAATSACLVTFQGSDHLHDFASITDASTRNYRGVYAIHGGILSEFQPLFEQVNFDEEPWTSCASITVTGHSLGGSLAQLFAAVLTANDQMPSVDEVYIYGAPCPFQGPSPNTCFTGASVASGYQDPFSGALMVDTIKVLPEPHKPLNLPLEVWAPTDMMALQPGQRVANVGCPADASSSMDLSTFQNGSTRPGEPYAVLHSGGTYAGLLSCWTEPLVKLFRI